MDAQQLCDMLTEALDKFGTYNFIDKGPQEVINFAKIIGPLASVPEQEVEELLIAFAELISQLDHDKLVYGLIFAEAIREEVYGY